MVDAFFMQGFVVFLCFDIAILFILWYNNLKPTAVERRRNADAFENIRFRLRTLNH